MDERPQYVVLEVAEAQGDSAEVLEAFELMASTGPLEAPTSK